MLHPRPCDSAPEEVMQEICKMDQRLQLSVHACAAKRATFSTPRAPLQKEWCARIKSGGTQRTGGPGRACAY